PAGPRGGTHPRRPHPVLPRSAGLAAGTGWFPASQRWPRLTRPPSRQPASVTAETPGGAPSTAELPDHDRQAYAVTLTPPHPEAGRNHSGKGDATSTRPGKAA